MERRDPRPPDEQATVVDGTAAVKSPSDPDSNPAPGRDSSASSPTVVDLGSDAPTVVHIGSDAPTALYGASPPAVAGGRMPSVSWSGDQPILQPGTILGRRYEILKLLGQGGMGAVYHARDREVNRMVALKVIRPEMAGNPAILERFKQELVLSHQVTHRNVVRIYDLGDADGLKFITMEFIEGQDLRSLIVQKGTFPPEEAVEIMRQVCRALEAAHAVGVIHRDLKPQNIMRDTSGRVVVMDFGLARALDSTDGMTQTGAIVGTMEYMSPEQGLGKPLDERSDLFTVGLIFYELLTGRMPYQADSALASLLKRTHERAAPISSHNANIPRALSDIVAKCMEPKVQDRYQHVGEILTALEAWQGKGAAATLTFPAVGTWGKGVWQWIGVVAAAVVLVVAGMLLRGRFTKSPPPANKPVTVLVADFTNQTGDPIFEDTLEPMFNVALEGASFINAYNRGKARQLATKLPNPSQKLDEQSSRLVAVKEGIGAIVIGSLNNAGNGYNLSVKAIDAMTGKTLASAAADSKSKDELLLQVPKLAAPIRKALGDTTPESVQLSATQGTFVASNLEAVHQLGIGVEQQSAGKVEDAFQSYSNAAQLDPNLARAYSGMASVSQNLGHAQDAQKYAKLAMEHLDRITDRERYTVRGLYYITTENWQKCVEEYSELTKQYPASAFGHSNLALCYGRLLQMSNAMEESQRAVQIAQKDVTLRMNFALYSCYVSDFQSCEREVHNVLQINPAAEEAFLTLAYAQIGQNHLSQAAEAYQKLGKISAWGASRAASGLGDLALYQGRWRDGIQILEKGAAADMVAKDPDAAADKFVMLAYASLLRGDKPSVVTAAEKALASSQSAKIRFLAARAFVEVGETAKAQKLAAGLASGLQAQPQAFAKLIQGEAALKEHNPQQALQLFTEAKGLMDTWIGRFDLGRAYLEAGAFAEGDSEFDRCIKRRGEALELFQDDMPTSSYLPIAYYYQGRVREGLKSADYKDFYRTYLDLRGKSTEDPLLPEVRRRLGQ
jgi:eukaryotic-like serine/threonine-protein kinase